MTPASMATPQVTASPKLTGYVVLAGLGLLFGAVLGRPEAVAIGLAFLVPVVAAFGLSQKGVNFDSLDGEPVYIFFLLIAPEESAGPHLKALARISRMLKDKYFRELLKKSRDEKEILRIVQEEDAKKY